MLNPAGAASGWSDNLLHGDRVDLTRHGNLRTPSPLRVHTPINFVIPLPLPRAGKQKQIKDGLPRLLPPQGQGEAGGRSEMADDHAKRLVHSDLDGQGGARPVRWRPPN
jgi:hypothetical protein